MPTMTPLTRPTKSAAATTPQNDPRPPIITPAFVVVVIGGLGSFWGVVAAALLVGLVKGVMVGIGYSAASTAAIYLLMLLVLLFRPRGLFGERITRFE